MRYDENMIKTVPFSMRLPPDLKADLQKLADRENRTLTNYIETQLYAIVAKELGCDRQGRKA